VPAGREIVAHPGLPAGVRAQGLRLIEVDKADLIDLPDIVDVVAARLEKFIVFCDDLSFEDGEPGYKASNQFSMAQYLLPPPMC